MADGEQRTETFFSGYRVLEEPGYLKVAAVTGKRRQKAEQEEEKEVQTDDPAFIGRLQALKKGDRLPLMDLAIREGARQ